jgi:hypothetical protein
MKARRVRQAAVFVALLSIWGALAAAVPATAVVLDCKITIMLTRESGNLIVTEFSGANTTLVGNLSIAKPFPWVGNVTLHLGNPTEGSTLSPDRFEIPQGEQFVGAFVVHVEVPAGQPSFESIYVDVMPVAHLGGGTCVQGSGHSYVGVRSYYGAITGGASPSLVVFGSEGGRANVTINVTEATNDDRLPVQAFVAAGVVSGITISTPRLVNMTVFRQGHVATSFVVAIEAGHAAPGVYDIVVNATSNGYGTLARENASSVAVVIRVVVAPPLPALQIATAITVGSAALIAVGLWTWKTAQGRGPEP